MLERNARRLCVCLSVLCLLLADAAIAQEDVLDVWAPGRSRSHYHDKVTMPFLETLQTVTGMKVRINGSSDPEKLEKACATFKADHVLVNDIEGLHFMNRYGYRLVAYGDAVTALYTLSSNDKALETFTRIGFLRRTGMDQAIAKELNIKELENRLVEFPSDGRGIQALFAEEVDGLVISRHIVEQLTPELRGRLTMRYRVKTPGRLMVLVSPRLAPALQDKLQRLYLSKDPVIQNLFLHRAGLTIHSPEDLPGWSEAKAQ